MDQRIFKCWGKNFPGYSVAQIQKHTEAKGYFACTPVALDHDPLACQSPKPEGPIQECLWQAASLVYHGEAKRTNT